LDADHLAVRDPVLEGAVAWWRIMTNVLPSLSGMIRDHAALFVSNPELPLSAMPFASV
jgi:hypothetical protein